MKIDPVPEMFPLMAEDELDELDADIKTNGLINPIVLDSEGTLIDGRNRLEACCRAEIEPIFEDHVGSIHPYRRRQVVAASNNHREGTCLRHASSRRIADSQSVEILKLSFCLSKSQRLKAKSAFGARLTFAKIFIDTLVSASRGQLA